MHFLPFKVAQGTKSREFQYKILNSYLVANTILKKVGKVDSSVRTFYGVLNGSLGLEHLLVSCHFTTAPWRELIACKSRHIKVESL